MSRARAHRVTALLVGGLVLLAQFPATRPARAAEPGALNQAPVASDVFTSTPQDVAETLSLLASDPDGDPLTYTTTQPANGGVACEVEVCTYTPELGFFGVDSFTYVANDGTADSNVATVSVTVNENLVVEAVNDRFTVLSGMTTTLDVTINDTDWDGGGLTVTAASDPEHGDLSCTGPTCDYTPDASHLGADGFTYTVRDINGDTASASVTIRVVKCSSAIGACIDNGVIRLGVRPEGHLHVPGGPPSPVERTTTVGIRYLATGNEAIASGCECEGWGAADAITGVTGYANQTDGGATNVTVESFTATPTTAVSVVTVGGVFRVTHDYHPSQQTPNLYEVSVSVKNISAEPVDLRYRRVMDWDIEPTAFAEFVTSSVGTSPSVIANTNDGFASANPLAPTSGGGVTLRTGNFTDAGPDDHGALFDFGFGILAPGSSRDFTIWYGAAADEAGAMLALARAEAQVYSLGQPSTPNGPSVGTPNTFVFGFSGVGGDAVNAAPSATDDVLDPGTTEDTPRLIAASELLANDTDPDGDTLVISAVAADAGTHGTVALNADGSVTYTPAGDHFGPAAFTYTVSDGDGGTDAATVTLDVAPANDAPTADDQTLATAFETALPLTLTASDPDGDSLTFTVGTAPANGTLACTGVDCTYTPDAGFSGSDSFTFTASDGIATSAPGTIGISVAAPAGPTLSVADASHSEGNAPGSLGFEVTLSSPATTTVTVAFATSDGTAATPADYAARTGTLTFAAGQTTQSIAVPTVGDLLAEADETFIVELSAPTGATIADGLATGTIVNDDDCTVVGTNAADSLVGTPGADVICALAGDDTVNGLGGSDVLRGGDGADLVTYFDAPTAVASDLAAGTASGWGDDTLSSFEDVTGSEHADRLVGDAGANVLSGLGGADELIGRSGDDDLLGGNGTDTADFRGAPGGVTVDLARNRATGWGSDRLLLVENAIGSAFADTLLGNGAGNALSGDAGNDTLVGGAGDDELRGGDGTDTADYQDSRGAVTVDLRTGAATGDGTDLVESVENVIGTARDDSLVGDDGANVLTGLGGDDAITGWFGDDDLRGGAGGDAVLYDAIAAGAGPMTVNLTTGAAAGAWGNDSLSLFEDAVGTPFADSIIGTAGDNVLSGRGGADTINGLAGDDIVSGGDGNDTLLGGEGRDTLNGDEGSDQISGEGDADEIAGHDGNDSMSGGAGNDSLSGGSGQDSILGDDGNDTLVGGAGGLPDTLNGGAGKDSCSDAADTRVSCEKP